MRSLGITNNLVKIHCIIHQETLCQKSLKLENVMDIVAKTVNLIQSCGLNYRQFKQFSSDTLADFGDISYFSYIRWLSDIETSACHTRRGEIFFGK